jgi:hypothetical protein
MNTYAHLTSFLPRGMALRTAALVDAAHAAASRVLAKIALLTWRNVDAVDGLDGRMLRDIGVCGWSAARDAQHDRDALRSRLDTEFRG